jgi:hypothetical protein
MTTARSTFAVTATIGVALAFAGFGPADAAVTSVSGAAVKVAAPASVVEDAYESDTELRVFDERQAVTLDAPLPVDITSSGTYDGSGALSPGTIAAGTVVDSHLLHGDAVGSPEEQQPVLFSGAATFDGEILGVIVVDNPSEAHLHESDFLGAAGTAYPPAGSGGRGLELSDLGGGDSIVVSSDHTVSLTLAMHRYDQVRVITASVPVTTTTTAATTSTTMAPTTTTTIGTEVLGVVETAPEAELPRTGTDPGRLALLGLVAISLGTLVRGFRSRPDQS